MSSPAFEAAVVFAAGLGTRLKPLTDFLPKIAVPLLNRPLGSFAFERLRAAGITRVAANTHHLAPIAEATLAQLGAEFSLQIVRESELLGTGGGLHNLVASGASPERGPLLVMNSDVLFWPDLEKALEVHQRTDAFATMVLTVHPGDRSTVVQWDPATERVVALMGRRAPEAPKAAVGCMFTGVHLLSPRALRALAPMGCIVREGYLHWLEAGERLSAVLDPAPFRDVGTIDRYLEAHRELLHGTLHWPSFTAPNVANLIDATAEIEGAELRGCTVGAGAEIASGLTLRDCVVWPETIVEQSGERQIAGPWGVIGATNVRQR